jgi:hypothetical protein
MLTRAPAASPSTTPSHLRIKLSNRHWMRLEIPVTHTKQTPDPFLIDNGNAPFRATHRPWGSQFWLGNEARLSLQCVSSASTQRVAQAGVGLCAVASASSSASAVASAFDFPPLMSSRGPFTGRRISLRFSSEAPRNRPSPLSAPVTAGQRSALTRQLLTLSESPVATQLIISNRSARRLEMPESYTKQRTGPLSNRHKFTHHNATSLPTSSPQHRKHEPQESEQRDGRFPRHLFFSKTTFCLARANPVA